MDFLDIFKALFMLGLPVAIMSWVLFSWIFLSGEVERTEKRKEISTRVKKLKTLPSLDGSRGKKYIYEKWAWFGSGFYGLAGLWTLAVIEVSELIGFITNPSGMPSFDLNSLIGMVIEFFIDQLGNIIQAFMWWSYWPAESMLVWLAVAYLGYWAGVEAARRTEFDTVTEALNFVRNRFGNKFR